MCNIDEIIAKICFANNISDVLQQLHFGKIRMNTIDRYNVRRALEYRLQHERTPLSYENELLSHLIDELQS